MTVPPRGYARFGFRHAPPGISRRVGNAMCRALGCLCLRRRLRGVRSTLMLLWITSWLLVACGLSLGEAAGQGDLEAVQDRVARGGDMQARVDRQTGHTPLHRAAHEGHGEVVLYLLETGADIHRTDRRGDTPLHLAAAQGHLAVVRHLMAHGAQPDLPDQRGMTPLHLAATSSLPVLAYLVEQGLSLEVMDMDGKTPLHWAAARGHVEHMQYLLAQGAPVDANVATQPTVPASHLSTHEGGTPLHHAVQQSQLQAVQYLLAHGADVHARDLMGQTPLHRAVLTPEAQVPALMAALLAHGAQLDSRDRNGHTPLHRVAMNRLSRTEARMVALTHLVQAGARLDARGHQGNTPLHLAAWGLYGPNQEAVAYLVAQGADHTLRNGKGQTPLAYARQGCSCRRQRQQQTIAFLQSLEAGGYARGSVDPARRP